MIKKIFGLFKRKEKVAELELAKFPRGTFGYDDYEPSDKIKQRISDAFNRGYAFETAKRIRFNYYSKYDTETGINGRDYGFRTEYTKLPDGKWEVSYVTTSEVYYCPCCGSPENHFDYEKEEYSCGYFSVITNEELEKIVRRVYCQGDVYFEVLE